MLIMIEPMVQKGTEIRPIVINDVGLNRLVPEGSGTIKVHLRNTNPK
jgi:hypothetical protein